MKCWLAFVLSERLNLPKCCISFLHLIERHQQQSYNACVYVYIYTHILMHTSGGTSPVAEAKETKTTPKKPMLSGLV